MKKLFFVALAAVAMTFTACKNETKPATEPAEENTEAVAEVNYTDSLKAALENSDASKIEQFVNEVKEKITGVDAAKFAPQLEAVQTWLKENADKVKEVLGEKWLTNKWFRLGTSRLANLLLSELTGEETKFF